MLFEFTDSDNLREEMQRLCAFLVENNASENAVFNSRLAVTELVGNVLKHAKTTATVRVENENGRVEIYVYSSMPYTPPASSCCSAVHCEHGRGLFLVDSVCEFRTVTEDGAIKIILKK